MSHACALDRPSWTPPGGLSPGVLRFLVVLAMLLVGPGPISYHTADWRIGAAAQVSVTVTGTFRCNGVTGPPVAAPVVKVNVNDSSTVLKNSSTEFDTVTVLDPQRVTLIDCVVRRLLLIADAMPSLNASVPVVPVYVVLRGSRITESLQIAGLLVDAYIWIESCSVGCVPLVPSPPPVTAMPSWVKSPARWAPLYGPRSDVTLGTPAGEQAQDIGVRMFGLVNARVTILRSHLCGRGELATAFRISSVISNSSVAFYRSKLIVAGKGKTRAAGLDIGGLTDVKCANVPVRVGRDSVIRLDDSLIWVYANDAPALLVGFDIRGFSANAAFIVNASRVVVGGSSSIQSFAGQVRCSVGVQFVVVDSVLSTSAYSFTIGVVLTGLRLRSSSSSVEGGVINVVFEGLTTVVESTVVMPSLDAPSPSLEDCTSTGLEISDMLEMSLVIAPGVSVLASGTGFGSAPATTTILVLSTTNSTLRLERCLLRAVHTSAVASVGDLATIPLRARPLAVQLKTLSGCHAVVDSIVATVPRGTLLQLSDLADGSFCLVRNLTWPPTTVTTLTAAKPVIPSTLPALLMSLQRFKLGTEVVVTRVTGVLAEGGFRFEPVSTPMAGNVTFSHIDLFQTGNTTAFQPKFWSTDTSFLGYVPTNPNVSRFITRCLTGPNVRNIAAPQNFSCGDCLRGLDCMGGVIARMVVPDVVALLGGGCQCVCPSAAAPGDRDCVEPLGPMSADIVASSPSVEIARIQERPVVALTRSRSSSASRTVQRSLTEHPSPSDSFSRGRSRSISLRGTRSLVLSRSESPSFTLVPAVSPSVSETPFPEVVEPLEKAIMTLGYPLVVARRLYYFVSTAGVPHIVTFPYMASHGVVLARLAQPFDCEPATLGLQMTPNVRDVFYVYPFGQSISRFLKGALVISLAYVFVGQGLLALLLHNLPHQVLVRTGMGMMAVGITAYFLPSAATYAVKIGVVGEIGDGFAAAGGALCVALLLAFPAIALYKMPSVYLAYRMFDRGAKDYLRLPVRFYVFVDVAFGILLSADVAASTQSTFIECAATGGVAIFLSLLHVVYMIAVRPQQRWIDLATAILSSLLRLAYVTTSFAGLFAPAAVPYIAYLALSYATLLWACFAGSVAWRGFRHHRRIMNDLPHKRGLLETEMLMTEAR